MYHSSIAQLRGVFTYNISTYIILLQISLQFYMLHTWHITYWLLYKTPHVLRIKWCRPSWNTDSIRTIFGLTISPQCYDTDLSTNLFLWPSHVSRDINARLDIFWEFQPYILAGTTFQKWLSHADFIFFTFLLDILLGYVNSTKRHCYQQWYISPLRWWSHAILTDWEESYNYEHSLQ